MTPVYIPDIDAYAYKGRTYSRLEINACTPRSNMYYKENGFIKPMMIVGELHKAKELESNE